MSFTVNHVGGQATSGAPPITSDSWASTTGSTIVAIGHTFNVASFSSGQMTDSKGNSYTFRGGATASSAIGIGVWDNIGGTRGASHNVTISPGGGTEALSVIEFSGTGTITWDTTTLATATDATSPLSVTAAAALSGTAIGIYGAAVDNGVLGTWGDPAGYSTILSFGDGSAGLVFYSGQKIGESGTPTVSATYSAAISSAKELFASYSDSGGGAGPVPNLYVVQSNLVW